MDKQSKKLLLKAKSATIASVEIVTTDGVQQLVFDLVSKKQKLYSIVLFLRPNALVSQMVTRNSKSVTKLLSEYTGLFIENIKTYEEHIIICTNGSAIHINLNEAKFIQLSREEGYNLLDNLRLMGSGF